MATKQLTYKGVLKMFRKMSQETDRKIREVAEQQAKTAEQQAKTDLQIERTNKKIESLGSRVGEIVENMVGGDIVGQFQALNIAIHAHSRDKTFGIKGTDESGQIDVFLENGDVVILIEVKTKLTDEDVRIHIERLEKYRLFGRDKRRILGAVAGAVAPADVIKFAHRKGLYVIVQSGVAVEIVPTSENFQAKEW